MAKNRKVKDFVDRGWAELAAAGRQGLKEVGQMLPAFPESNVRPVEEPGTFGNPVAREVYDQRHPDQDAHLAETAQGAGKQTDKDAHLAKSEVSAEVKQPEIEMERD